MQQLSQSDIKINISKIEESKSTRNSLLLVAAMALPAIQNAHAETVPEHGVISYKYLDYLDSQGSVPSDAISGASTSTSKDRIKVKANSLMVMTPIAGNWSITGSYVGDSISGASPEYHDKQLIKLEHDVRHAANLSVTRYLPRGTVTVGVNQSNERDYISRGFSLQGTLASEDKNTTFNAGVAVTNDRINSANDVANGESKHTTDWLLGVTQVLTMNDIVQANLGYSDGSGYFSDPYKFSDTRPDSKYHFTLSTRWNHHFDHTNGSSHLGYRYYKDSFEVKSQTFSAEYVQPFGNGWSLTPLVRYYSQTAANFYVGIDPASPEYFNLPAMKYLSLDERLAEFGALTWGLKLAKQIDKDWLVDFKYEQYKQKESWALGSNSGDALSPFNFRSFQIGVSRKF